MNSSFNSLSAQVGDKVTFQDAFGMTKTSTVVEALWVEAPKGGRIWSYRVSDGDIIPNESVSAIDARKSEMSSDDYLKPSPFEGVSSMELAMLIIEDSDEVPSVLKAAIQCLIDGDLKSLDTARFLVGNRINQVMKMQIDEAPCLAITKER